MGKENFNRACAIQLWTEVYCSGFTWECPDEVVRIAAMCGLGVLTIKARKDAVDKVRADYLVGRAYNLDRYNKLDPSECTPRWADYLLEAARRYPPSENYYPIREPCGHVVGVEPCFGQARTGKWWDEDYRAAWGNIPPFGLEEAVKSCPQCGQLMKYWCWDKQTSQKYGLHYWWSIDHKIPHTQGGCVCRFNLQALHLPCNISKGGRS